MNALEIALLALTCVGSLYYVLSTVALKRHFRPSADPDSSTVPHSPRVSILKPVCGRDYAAEYNFLTFLSQDYPDYEVLFGVLEPDDPATGLIERIVGAFHRASFHSGSEITGANNKVRILHNLAGHATGDIIVIADADTRATPDFLRKLTRPFADESVGAVTCLYRGVQALTFGDTLEGLHMTCVFAPGVASAECLGRIDFGLGATIAVRRSVLDRIGGFEALADYLADDFQLGRKVANAGFRVVLSDYVIEIALSGEDIGHVLSRELRWCRTTRVSRPIGHFGLVLTFGFAYAAMFWLASGWSAWGWLALLGVAGLRALTAHIGACGCLGDREFPHRLYLLPARDLLSFGLWVAGYFSRTVTWRGRRLKVGRDGKMIPA